MKKRCFSILMALCMVLTLAVPAVATDGEPTSSTSTPEVITAQENTPSTGGEGEETEIEGSASVDPDVPAENVDGETDEIEWTITPDMSQAEVDAAVDAAESVITIQAGNYGIDGEMNHIKINLDNGNQTVQLEENGSYQRLMFVVLSSDNTLIGNGATIDGEVSEVHNQSPAIYIPKDGDLHFQGTMTITDHCYGVILGYSNVSGDKGTCSEGTSSEFMIDSNAKLIIEQCNITTQSDYDNGIVCSGTDYFSYVGTQGDGTKGSGITTKGKGYTKVTVSESAELSITDCTGSAIFSVTVSNFTLDIQTDAEVNLKNNAQGLNMNTDYSGSIDVIVDHATLEITNNRSNGVTGQSLPYVLDIKGQSAVNINNNGGIGINNFFIKVADSQLSVSNNASHGATNVALNAVNSTVETNGNGYRGLNITKANIENDQELKTQISNSTIVSNNNKQSGIYFINPQGTTIENGSTVQTEGNGSSAPGSSFSGAGIVGSYDITIANSSVNSKDPHSFSVSHTSSAPAVWYVKENTIAVAQGTSTASDQDIVDDPNSDHPEYLGNVIITGGSLNASQDIDYTSYQNYLQDPSNWKYEDIEALVSMTNDQKEDLFRFHLNAESNAVVGGAGQKQFNYPYQNNSESLNYQFVYDENGDAYVWTPVTVVNYDATEGTVQEGSFGTATPIEDSTQGLDAGDVTIYGNSLALAEKTLPTATRDGYVFGGWYYAIGKDDISQAAQYASEGNYNDLYTLLKEHGAKLESTTLTSEDGEDLSNITVYAVWEEAVISIKPVDLTVYMGGDDGYEAVVGGDDGQIIGESSNSLPQPIFTLQASDGTENLDGLQFTSGEKTWTAQVIPNVDGSLSNYYTLTAAEGQDPVRVTYTGEDEIPHISDSFEIIQEGDVFTTYEIALYTNQVEIGSVTATLNGKTYSVNASQTGKLTVRAVEDTEDNAAVSPVVKEAPPERLESGTGLIVAKPDTQYTVNNLGIPVPAGGAPSLLFDSIITNDGIDRETRLEQEVAEQLPALGQYQTRHYQSQYLDLVDANNGNIWLKANQAITVYWAYPQGTDANDDFTLWHFEGLHREGENSGFEIGDVETAQLEQVTIQKDAYGISFTVEPGGFSPFVLTWTEYDRPPVDPITPIRPPVDPDKPGLNTEDHYAYIVGYPDGNVKPEGNITRAEVATIFFRLLTDESRDEFWSQTNPYSDVSEDDWYNNAVSTLTNAGIIDGYEDGTFKPNGNITRAEFATIAVRFFEATYEGENLFPDIDGHWAQDYINEAANAGIVDGYPDGTFGPQKLITRAEAMTMVNRTIDRHPDADHLLDDMIVWPDNPETAWYYEQVQEATNSHEYTMHTDDEQNPYEIWTELLPVRNWAQLEKEWSDAHSGQSGGDVV